MEAKELRIGNLVSYRDETKCVVTSLGSNGFETISDVSYGLVYGSNDITDYKPIPITKEWLLKFGFEKSRHSYDICNNWHYGINPITKDWLFCLKWIDGDDFPFYMNGHFEINHAHQLQNLYFALTGEELKLNEK